MSDGKDLRTQLEEALQENQELRASVAELTAGTVVRGLDLVKAQDLEGVAPDEMADKAKELQASRQEQQRDLIRQTFVQRGLDGDDLEQAVNDFLEGADTGPTTTTDDTDVSGGMLDRMRELGGGDAGRVEDIDLDAMTPSQKIEHGLRVKARKQRA